MKYMVRLYFRNHIKSLHVEQQVEGDFDAQAAVRAVLGPVREPILPSKRVVPEALTLVGIAVHEVSAK